MHSGISLEIFPRYFNRVSFTSFSKTFSWNIYRNLSMGFFKYFHRVFEEKSNLFRNTSQNPPRILLTDFFTNISQSFSRFFLRVSPRSFFSYFLRNFCRNCPWDFYGSFLGIVTGIVRKYLREFLENFNWSFVLKIPSGTLPEICTKIFFIFLSSAGGFVEKSSMMFFRKSS